MTHHVHEVINRLKERLTMAIADDLNTLTEKVGALVADDAAKTVRVGELEAQVASLNPNAAADLAAAQAELADAQAQVAALTAQITASLPVPLTVTSSVVAGVSGAVIVPSTIAVVGGTAPYTVSVTSSVPDGIVIDTAGNISGTPTAPGDTDVSVLAADTAGSAATGTVSIQIV